MSQGIVYRELRRTIRSCLGAGSLTSFRSPPMYEVHSLVDQIAWVEGCPLIGVVSSVLSNLRDVPARMIEGLTWSVPVQRLAATSSHVAWVERGHDLLLSAST
jgi:hypothetical protein